MHNRSAQTSGSKDKQLLRGLDILDVLKTSETLSARHRTRHSPHVFALPPKGLEAREGVREHARKQRRAAEPVLEALQEKHLAASARCGVCCVLQSGCASWSCTCEIVLPPFKMML